MSHVTQLNESCHCAGAPRCVCTRGRRRRSRTVSREECDINFVGGSSTVVHHHCASPFPSNKSVFPSVYVCVCVCVCVSVYVCVNDVRVYICIDYIHVSNLLETPGLSCIIKGFCFQFYLPAAGFSTLPLRLLFWPSL